MNTKTKRRKDMSAGHLYIVQYPHSPYFKLGRSMNYWSRLLHIPTGTALHFTMLT